MNEAFVIRALTVLVEHLLHPVDEGRHKKLEELSAELEAAKAEATK